METKITDMTITLFEAIQLLVGSGVLISAVVGVFRMGKFSQRFDSLEKSITKLATNERVEALENSMKELSASIKEGFAKIDSRFDRLERLSDEKFYEKLNVKAEPINKS
jgi:hypothetical protein